MSSSFLRLQRLLADPRLCRWGPALLAALVCQQLVVFAVPPVGPDTRRARRGASADDTPTLLLWSRAAAGSAPAASLQSIPLQGLATLPPPPPSTLPHRTSASPPTTPPVPRRNAAAASPAVSVQADDAGLPRHPGEAFSLARMVAQGSRPKQASAAMVAVQRRQWWLLAGQNKALQSLWEDGLEQAPPPVFGSMPEGVGVRQVAATATPAPLAFGALHGRSLLDGEELWLLWRQGTSLWILRGALESSPES